MPTLAPAPKRYDCLSERSYFSGFMHGWHAVVKTTRSSRSPHSRHGAGRARVALDAPSPSPSFTVTPSPHPRLRPAPAAPGGVPSPHLCSGLAAARFGTDSILGVRYVVGMQAVRRAWGEGVKKPKSKKSTMWIAGWCLTARCGAIGRQARAVSAPDNARDKRAAGFHRTAHGVRQLVGQAMHGAHLPLPQHPAVRPQCVPPAPAQH
jgi:hypothetical protein